MPTKGDGIPFFWGQTAEAHGKDSGMPRGYIMQVILLFDLWLAAILSRCDRNVGEDNFGMMADTPTDHRDIREAVQRLCANFLGAYWQDLDRAVPIQPNSLVR
jgi:hypothetical protein